VRLPQLLSIKTLQLKTSQPSTLLLILLLLLVMPLLVRWIYLAGTCFHPRLHCQP
jgi:hypothetical protein